MSIRKHPIYSYLIATALVVGLVILFLLAKYSVTQEKWLAIDDYVEYWAAGKLNITGGNPYNPAELLPLQYQAGRHTGVPVIMYNPPWMLAIAMPFGTLDYALGRIIWLLLSISITIACSDLIWIMYGGPIYKRWLGWLIGFSFVPVLDCLRVGQTGIFMLLGVVGFLYFQHQRGDWLAGACLALLAIKPHIFFLFGIAILFWCIQYRRWIILSSAISVLAFATLLAWAVNPSVFQQYLYTTTHYPLDEWATATLASVFRIFLAADIFWLQFVLPVIGIIWLSIYWLKHRSNWNWLSQAPLILLISVCTSAYGWTFDQPALLVAILAIFTRIFSTSLDRSAWFVIVSFLLIDGVDLAMRVPQIWLWWLAPSLLIWYLVANRFIARPLTAIRSTSGEPIT